MFSFRNILPAVRRLFGVKSEESVIESAVEERWDEEYRDIRRLNFTQIFADRLAKYTFAGTSVRAYDPMVDAALMRCMRRSRKWCQLAIGTGRAFLIPYVIGSDIYTDIITQGRAIATRSIGDDLLGIAVLADMRYYDKKWYARWTRYEFSPEEHTFTVENKATEQMGGAEVPLSAVPEWSQIEPLLIIEGVDRPLFAYVDSPKDNRTTDRLQGAPITFGCDETIREIYECIAQYRTEFRLKRAFLGVDKLMLDKDGVPMNELYRTFEGKDTESLFEIFSPEIRDSSYRERLYELFARLEKEVGTSNGILTPADTSMATATQVRRAMFDTFAMVGDIRDSVSTALKELCYAYGCYLELLGIPFSGDIGVDIRWGDEFIRDSAEAFAQMMDAQSIGAVSREEIRAQIFPEETSEVARAVISEIDMESSLNSMTEL